MLTISFPDQSRKRGTLESDLLLSTFAAANLPTMTSSQLKQYDLFLDENDWDIYYWATQSPAGTSTSLETAEGSVQETPPQSTTEYQSPATPGQAQETDAWRQGAPRSGEWAQTVGTFKPAYRPVPQRWKNSEILSLLRKHVRERSAGGVVEDVKVEKVKGGGLGRMPDIQVFDS
jgi:succinate dehydrogenase flavin-adding protein (antitoxin of CptAB toxin-antitoxin module)